MPLTHSILSYIKKQKLIDQGDHVIVGVSGGADSMSLLYILLELRHELGIQLSVAHYNHQLRQGSTKDQQFVKKICDKLQLPFYTENWKHPKLKGSIEEKAREKRLAFFHRVKTKIRANKIALAHTQDDQAETVLMRLIRGSGLKGLQAILPITRINQLLIIRPLLFIQKKELINFLKIKKIPFRVDPTNQSFDFTRNKIRHRLLPLLAKDYNPNIVSALSTLAENTADDYAFLHKTTKNLLPKGSKYSKKITLQLSKLRNKPKALIKMMLRSAIEKIQGNTRRLTNQHIIDIIELINHRPTSSIVYLPRSITVKKTASHIIFEKK